MFYLFCLSEHDGVYRFISFLPSTVHLDFCNWDMIWISFIFHVQNTWKRKVSLLSKNISCREEPKEKKNISSPFLTFNYRNSFNYWISQIEKPRQAARQDSSSSQLLPYKSWLAKQTHWGKETIISQTKESLGDYEDNEGKKYIHLPLFPKSCHSSQSFVSI